VPNPGNVLDYNRYMYVRGSPIMYNDPSGHCPLICIGLLAAVAAMLAADSQMSPEEIARTEKTGEAAATFVFGEFNDPLTVITGYDHLTQEDVPYGSTKWKVSAGAALVPAISGAAARSFHAGFGLSDYLGGLKHIVPDAKTYRDFGLDSDSMPMEEFANNLRGMMDKAEKIHFNLTGMRDINGVLDGPLEWNPLGSTNWELRTIWDDAVLKANTIFYRDGKIITPEEILELE